MRKKGEFCHMAFSPTEAPVYGGGTIVVAFSESSLLPGDEAELYLVFQGSSTRHITLARRLNTHSLQAIVPGHNCFELAQLSVYAFHNAALELLSDGMFNFVPDSTFFLAQFLAGSVRDVNALDNPASLKTDQFDLWSEDMSTLDERLACAFEHLELPPTWRLVEDSSRLDQDPPPRETLLHFAARLGLSQFAQQLLDKAGSDVALRLPNKNGELASDLARARGLEDLADRMLEHSLSGGGSPQHEDLGRVQTKSVSVKRHSIGTATITTKTGETTRTLEDDIQMLRELVSFMGEDMENESPPSTSRTPLEDSGSSSSYIPSGSKGGDRDSRNLDEDEDDEEEEEEEEEDDAVVRSPKLKVLEQSMQQLQAISASVQRLKDRNKALLTEEASRRESLSRFSASCPVLAEDNQRKEKGLGDLKSRTRKGYQSQTDADLPSRSPEPGSAIKIQVDDFALDDIAETSLLSPDTEDGLDGSDSSPEEADLMPDPDILELDLLEPEEELPFPRRHSWGPDPEDLGLKNPNDSQLLGENLGFSSLSKSMVHLDTDSGDEFLDAKDTRTSSRLSPHHLEARLSPHHLEGRLSPRHMDGRLSPRHMMEGRISPLLVEPREPKEKDYTISPTTSPTTSPSHVTLVESPVEEQYVDGSATDTDSKQTSPSAEEPDNTGILLPDNSGVPLATAAQISAVPRRRKKTESLKEIRAQRSASMFEPRRPFSRRPLLPIHTQGSIQENDDDSDTDSPVSTPRSPKDVEELIRTLPASQKRQARLSLTEFLSDPRNFLEEGEQQAVQSAVEGASSIAPSAIPGHMEPAKGVFRRLSLFKGGSTRKSKEKREKDKDKDKGKHQYVPVSFSNSTKCEYCDKSMANKDALQCQVCLVNVHNSNACKDNIACNKLTKHPKQATKSASLAFRDKVGINSSKSQIGYSQSFKEKTRPSSTHGFHRPLTQKKLAHSAHIDYVFRKTPETMSFQGSLQDLRLGQHNTRTIEETEEASEDNVESPKSVLSNNNMSASMESLEDVSTDILQVDDEDIVTRGPEPESWSVTVEKKILKKMSHKEIKRQDVIFEFIMTEKHHVRTLKIMQKIFSYGMQHELHMDQSVISKVFPMLDHLVEIAVSFYDALKERQQQATVVEKFGDILVNQFSGSNGDNMLTAYGLLCSRQTEAVSVYKDLYKNDRKFQAFIKKCSLNALCRRWSIPECILSVSHRLTKYQLLIEAIMKPTKSISAHKVDTPLLERALTLIKGICKEVDYQVEEYEKWQRLLEIYNKVEARSSGILKSGKKFRKSDLLSNNRKLRHEGELLWKSARGKLTEIHAVLLTDVLIFLQENNQKFTFASQDNKPPIVPLHKLMVRDVAIDKRSIYLISPNKVGPEMYEVMCTSTSNRKRWKQLIEEAVQQCPDEDEGVVEDEIAEEKKAAEARAAKIKKLLESMQEKDKQLNSIMEEKNKLMEELKETVTKEDLLGTLKSTVFKERDTKMQEARDVLLAAIQEASRLTSVVYTAGAGGLSRSASSAGERASGSYQTHALPKRAETFSGFDTAAGVKRRFNLENKESDRLSGSFPNLAPNRLDVVEGGPGSPQGSNPNLTSPDSPRLSPNPRTPLTSPTISEPCRKDFETQESVSSQEGSVVRFATDSPTPLNQLPIQEGSNNYEQQSAQLYTREQIACANLLLQHLNALLSITTMKDTAYESMKTELLEANKKIESLSGSKKPHRTNSQKSTPTSPTPVIVTTPPPAKKSTPEKKQKEGTVKKNEKNEQEEPSNLNNIKVPQPADLGNRAASEQNLRRIAFGDYGLTQDSPSHAGNGTTMLDSPRSIMKRTGSDPPPRISHDSGVERSNSVSNRRRDEKSVPTHLLSATNEMQAASGLVRQKLPMKLSNLSSTSSSSSTSTTSTSSSSPVQQMLPKKLSSNSKSSSKGSSKLSHRNSGSKKNNQNVQAADQDVIYF